MRNKLLRVGTSYIPVTNVQLSADWYKEKLNAILNYQDEDKAIIDMANQSFFLIKSDPGQSSNFYDIYGKECFSITFEVDGLDAIHSLT